MARSSGAREPLCAPVVLVDDRAEPLHHLVLDVHRARGGRMDHALQARHVVGVAHGTGQFQHPHEHGRHELRMGDAVGLDEPQHRLGVELAHQDRGGTDPVHRHRVVDARRVVQRRRRQIHARRGHVVALATARAQAPSAPTNRCRRSAAAGERPWAARWCPTSRASRTRPKAAAPRPPMTTRRS